MGQPKQLLSWKGKTVLEQVLGTLSSLSLAGIVVVLGFKAREIAKKIGGRPVEVVVNRRFRQGMASSIRVGLRHVSPDSGIMLFLADQPLIGVDIISRLLEEFDMGRGGIVVPVYRGRRGHPVLFHARYRAEMARLRGDVGAREIIAAHEEDVVEVEASDAILRDIDTPQDYRLMKDLEGGNAPNEEGGQAG